MSREALRKANHSMIERRRREKINAALGDLRDMVPGLGGETKGGEFKLEVGLRFALSFKAVVTVRMGPNGRSSSELWLICVN